MCHVNSIYFAYPRMAGSVDAEAVHFNWNTVELEGKGELEKWNSYNLRPGTSCGTSMINIYWTVIYFFYLERFEDGHFIKFSEGSPFIMSVIPIRQQACFPLLKYQVVPLTGRSLTLYYLYPTNLSTSYNISSCVAVHLWLKNTDLHFQQTKLTSDLEDEQTSYEIKGCSSKYNME